MKADVMIFPSAAERSERASERAARPRTNGRATDVEIASLEKKLRDMAQGMRNLRDLHPKPHDINQSIIALAAKINAVQSKLFRLRQLRFI